MFTRKKLKQILERQQKDTEKLYIQNFFTPEDDFIDKLQKKTKNFNGFGVEVDGNANKDIYTDDIDIASLFYKGSLLKKSTKTNNKETPIATATSTLMNAQTMKLNSETIHSKKITADYENLDTFHRAVQPVLLIAQCFSVMPLVGVSSYDPHNVKFSYFSVQIIVCLTFLCSNALLFVAMLKHLMILGINAKNVVGLVFFSCAQVACIFFILLARRWPKLIKNWTKVEMIFLQSSSYEEPKRNLKKRVRSAAFAIIGLAIIEHALSVVSAVLSYTRKVHICAQVNNITKHVSFDEYISSNYNYVFSLLKYHTIAGIFILVTNGMSTFIWNYMDIFIMMISKGIAYRFEQIMMRINKVANQNVSERTFIEIRTHYVQVCELLDKVDEHLSEIILLSCINNLYFVCYQLLNIFNKLRWPINHIYFWYSLLYLIGRTAFVFLTAATINDESKSALSALRSISHRSWCVEMAGTIVTYELVLLQFDEENRSHGLPPLCQ